MGKNSNMYVGKGGHTRRNGGQHELRQERTKARTLEGRRGEERERAHTTSKKEGGGRGGSRKKGRKETRPQEGGETTKDNGKKPPRQLER